MAAGALPEPGTKYGPCLPKCEHRDCAALRSNAASICRICGKRIGYDTRFYRDDAPETYVHALCFEDECERSATKA